MDLIETKWILLQRYLSNLNIQNVGDSAEDTECLDFVPDVIRGKNCISQSLKSYYDYWLKCNLFNKTT